MERHHRLGQPPSSENSPPPPYSGSDGGTNVRRPPSSPIAIVGPSAATSSSSSRRAKNRGSNRENRSISGGGSNGNGSSSSNSSSSSDDEDDDGDDYNRKNDDDSELNEGMGALFVGSLPTSRRGGGNGGFRIGNSGRSSSLRGMAAATSRSLPPPRAPFLSARENPRERLKSMPPMTLPESATEVGSEGGGSSYVPYGSLRESRFSQSWSVMSSTYSGPMMKRRRGTLPQRTRRRRSGDDQHQQHVRFAGDEASGSGDNEYGSSSLSSGVTAGASAAGDRGGLYRDATESMLGSAVPRSFVPHSLPAYMDAERDLVRRRWEASAGAASDRDNTGVFSSTPLVIGSGGSSIARGGVEDGSPSLLSAQLGDGIEGLDGAIGSACDADEDDKFLTLPPHGRASDDYINDYEDQVEADNVDADSLADYDDDEEGDVYREEGLLSTSLTALEVLETSRRDREFGSLGVKLSPAEIEGAKESATRATMSLNGLGFDTNGRSWAERHSFEEQSRGVPYEGDGITRRSGDSFAPLGAVNSNDLDDDRPGSPKNPDTVEAFDFDLDE